MFRGGPQHTSNQLSGRRWQEVEVTSGNLTKIRSEGEADKVLQHYINQGRLDHLERALNNHSHLSSPLMYAMACNARDNLLRRDASAVEPRRKGDHHSQECLLSSPSGGAPRYPKARDSRDDFITHYRGHSAPEEAKLGEHPFAVDEPEGYNAFPHHTASYEPNRDDRTRRGYSYAIHLPDDSPLQAYASGGSPGLGSPHPRWNYSSNTESQAVVPRSARPSRTPLAPGTRSDDCYDPSQTHGESYRESGRDYEQDHQVEWADVEVGGGTKLGKSSIYRYGVHKQAGFVQYNRGVCDGVSRRITSSRLTRTAVANFVKTGSSSANIWG